MHASFSPAQIWRNAARYARRSRFILSPNPYGETPILRARFNDAVFYSPSRNYLFASNEKVANSTMRATFQQLEGAGLPPHYKKFKRWTGPLLQPSDVANFEGVLGDPTVYKFCVVRDPHARLISCYRNKFEPDARGRAYPVMMRQLGFDPSKDAISFEKFVHAIADQNQREMNPHWRPQYYNVFMDRINYDEIIPYTVFSDRISALVKKFYPDVKHHDVLTSANRHATNSNELIDHYFDEPLKRAVRDIYAIDFERLGFVP